MAGRDFLTVLDKLIDLTEDEELKTQFNKVKTDTKLTAPEARWEIRGEQVMGYLNDYIEAGKERKEEWFAKVLSEYSQKPIEEVRVFLSRLDDAEANPAEQPAADAPTAEPDVPTTVEQSFHSKVIEKEFRDQVAYFERSGHPDISMTVNEHWLKLETESRSRYNRARLQVEWREDLNMYCFSFEVLGEKGCKYLKDEVTDARKEEVMRMVFGMFHTTVNFEEHRAVFCKNFPGFYYD